MQIRGSPTRAMQMLMKGRTSSDFAQLPQKICEILKQQECMVVLDDLWRYKDWDELKSAFESIKSSGSKVLITTRNKGLIQHIDPLGYSYNPNFLNDEDSWKLLQRITFSAQKENTGDKKAPSNYRAKEGEESECDQAKEQDEDMKAEEEMGREMLKHCKGLPLTILTLGGILCSKKTPSEWKTVQDNITSFLMGDLRQTGSDNNGLFGILELSYKDMPFYLKPCFMYLGHFPEDYEISVDRLFHLWEAEGLVTNSGYEVEEERLDDIAESYLNELVERCLVQVGKRWANGRIKKCRLHDVMRDMCLKKCKEVNFLELIDANVSSSRKKIASSSTLGRKLHRCALYLSATDSENVLFDQKANMAPTSMRSLLVFHAGEKGSCQYRRGRWQRALFTPDMMRSLSLLRVLDLQGARIPMHPKVIRGFIHLRFLSFREATLIPPSEPQYWNCKYLETLDLRWSDDVEVLISNKFWKLERLRHLYLPWDMQLRGSGKLLFTDNQLQQMETLKNFNLIGCRMEDMVKMASMRDFKVSTLCSLDRDVVEHFLKLPVLATKRLAYPLRLPFDADVINGDTSLLTAIFSKVCIGGIDILGRIEVVSSLEILKGRYLTYLRLSNTCCDDLNSKTNHTLRQVALGLVVICNPVFNRNLISLCPWT